MYNSRCTEIAAAVGLSSQVKVTQYLRGCPSEKKSYACCFKVNCNNLYINRKVMNCRIPKKVSTVFTEPSLRSYRLVNRKRLNVIPPN